MSRKGKPSTPAEIALRRAQEREQEALAEARLEWGISGDTLLLAAKRGEVITEFPARPGERDKPPKRLSGLDWLAHKGRITVTQLGAGLKYGDDYRLANDVTIRSGINYDRMGGDGMTSQEIRAMAFDRLKEAQNAGLAKNRDLIDIANAVAGEGTRVREMCIEEADVQRKEERLFIALDLLAAFYGMI